MAPIAGEAGRVGLRGGALALLVTAVILTGCGGGDAADSELRQTQTAAAGSGAPGEAAREDVVAGTDDAVGGGASGATAGSDETAQPSDSQSGTAGDGGGGTSPGPTGGAGDSGSAASESLAALPTLSLELVADGLTAPIALADPRDGTLLVADQAGFVWRVPLDGSGEPERILDIRDRMLAPRPNYDERGLLGLALEPGESPSRAYLYYSAPRSSESPGGWDHESHVSVFEMGADGIQAESETILMRIQQPQSNHNGGQLAFGPDGHLYIALGDGGSANDEGLGHPEGGNGQDRGTVLGSILRLAVEADRLTIPSDNPFVDAEGSGEIWAYGFRNPFRFSFDQSTGELIAGDVGQNRWEEVDVVERGGNYGWPLREGPDCFDVSRPDSPPSTCPGEGPYGEPLLGPVVSYRNSGVGGQGLAVIGGYVYRGADIPEMEGLYVFGDWSSSFSDPQGSLFVASRSETGWSMAGMGLDEHPEGRIGRFILALGQDADGEIYVLTSEQAGPTGSSGAVFRLTSGP